MKINVTNQEKLQNAINKVEGKSFRRCLSAEEILDYVNLIEDRLSIYFHKSQWQGIEFTVSHPFDVPSSYKGVPSSTTVAIQRGSSAWFVTSIERLPSRNHAVRLTTPVEKLHEKALECMTPKLSGGVFWNN